MADFLPAFWYFCGASSAYIEHVLLLELELETKVLICVVMSHTSYKLVYI